MLSLIKLFISVSLLDVLDILLVAVLLYNLYYLVKGTAAVNIFIGVILIYMLWLFVRVLGMELFGSILGKFIDVGVIALIIVFQQELRRFLLYLGASDLFSREMLTKGMFNLKANMSKDSKTDIETIVRACKSMAESKTGAIIVITKDSNLDFYVNTGDIIDSKVTTRMIESIFYKNSPLHDGAVIITGNYIRAARCVLPVTESADFPAHLGMRHRAAAGITENTDAFAIIVSEQTGEISIAKGGKLTHSLSSQRLQELLEKEFE